MQTSLLRLLRFVLRWAVLLRPELSLALVW
jgi:hypothetical protein